MHEKKYCARCAQLFECKSGTIAQCQCYGVELTMEERIFIEDRFTDCLCSNCLTALKNEYAVFKDKFVFG